MKFEHLSITWDIMSHPLFRFSICGKDDESKFSVAIEFKFKNKAHYFEFLF